MLQIWQFKNRRNQVFANGVILIALVFGFYFIHTATQSTQSPKPASVGTDSITTHSRSSCTVFDGIYDSFFYNPIIWDNKDQVDHILKYCPEVKIILGMKLDNDKPQAIQEIAQAEKEEEEKSAASNARPEVPKEKK
ncbi:hypothetical protein M7I_1208 [Glarea lozoyensis 74030]|uniref:Uncharacterized protein n=1 Tax=Glarea lozoyensis (strain ATCC 74030 / MF5533) TaxID=1104152 RepID=H0EFD5_GLAL7|nr:hypothetical protein M7I_1208 [Glarea lozoyensis 74030]